MATVDKSTAMDIIARDGYYPGDPRVTKVLSYTNNWGSTSYAIVYPQENQLRYELSADCHNVVVMWTAK